MGCFGVSALLMRRGPEVGARGWRMLGLGVANVDEEGEGFANELGVSLEGNVTPKTWSTLPLSFLPSSFLCRSFSFLISMSNRQSITLLSSSRA